MPLVASPAMGDTKAMDRPASRSPASPVVTAVMSTSRVAVEMVTSVSVA